MALYGSDDVAWVYIDGYKVGGSGGYITDLEDHLDATLEESHVLGDTWKSRAFTGEKDVGVEISGFFDDADNASSEAFTEQWANRLIAYNVEGNALGSNVVMLSGAWEGKWKRILKRGALHKVSITHEGNGEDEEGKLIGILATRTTAGNTESTKVDNADATTAGGAVHLHVGALTLGGYTNLIVKLRDSADGTTFADVTGGTFTAITAAPGKQRLALSGTIRRYTAIAWAYTGSGSGPSWAGIVGLHRN
jgi:hypothetical protein